ncbi:5563_t:CDS:2, partial [Entrophospora sp. SA101]
MSDNIEGSTLNQITIENGDSPTLTDIKRLGWDEGKHLSCSKIYKYSKEFVKSKLSINEISDKDKSDNPKDKPKVYINEISNNQCVVIQILFNLEKGKIIEYPKKIGNKIKKDNEGKGRIIILWKVRGKHLSCSKIYKYSKEFVKSKLSINEISDKDKSDNPKDKPKVYINEISNNQCVVIQILFNLEKGKIIEYPKKIGNKIKKDNEGKETPKLMMLRRSNKDEKKYKIYSMEYNSNADDHLELLDTHNIYSDETPKIYYDDNHFLAAASHSLISEWDRMSQNRFYGNYNYYYKQNYYLKSNDYMVLNKKSNAEEALMVADYRQDSKLVVYSLERNITVSSFEFKEKVHIKKVDFIYVKSDTLVFEEENDDVVAELEEKSNKGLFDDIWTQYLDLTKENADDDLSSLNDEINKISTKYWESTTNKEREEDIAKFNNKINKVKEVSSKKYWKERREDKKKLACLEDEVNKIHKASLEKYWTSKEKEREYLVKLENKIKGIEGNISISTTEKVKNDLAKLQVKINKIKENYWTLEKKEKEDLVKLEDKIKKIKDLNQKENEYLTDLKNEIDEINEINDLDQ